MRKPTIEMIRFIRTEGWLGHASDSNEIHFQGNPIIKKNGKQMTIGDFNRMSDRKVLKRIIRSMKRASNE